MAAQFASSIHFERRHTSLEDITAILEDLLPQGTISQPWIEKPVGPTGNRPAILVINGESLHVVVARAIIP